MELEEIICDKCKGSGKIYFISYKHNITYSTCVKCKGKGKVDWITNIIKEKENTVISDLKPLTMSEVLQLYDENKKY